MSQHSQISHEQEESKESMGIPGFQKWFLSTFPETSIPVSRAASSDSFDHIAFDMNQLLHTALRRAKNFDHLVRILFREIDTTLRICRPRRSVYFAFDGMWESCLSFLSILPVLFDQLLIKIRC